MPLGRCFLNLVKCGREQIQLSIRLDVFLNTRRWLMSTRYCNPKRSSAGISGRVSFFLRDAYTWSKRCGEEAWALRKENVTEFIQTFA